MSKLKVMHLTFNMAIGGTEQVILQLVKNCDPARHELAVLCLESPIGELGEKLRALGVCVIACSRGNSGLDLKLVAGIRRLIREREIDVLHCHQYTPYTYGLLASLGTAAAVVFTEHGRFYPDRSHWKRVLLNPLFNLATTTVTAISQATADALSTYEKFPKRAISVVYNGIGTPKVEPTEVQRVRTDLGIHPAATVVGTISRLDPIKNQQLMLRAFGRLLVKRPEAVLLIVGDGPSRVELECLTQSLGIESQVVFTGFKVDPHPYMAMLDVFLLPSLSEGTSMTVLEAMACATPSVVTNVGGNPEVVIDGETGFVTPSDDELSFSRALEKLVLDKHLRQRMGAKALEHYLARFTVATMVDHYERLYCEASGGGKARVGVACE